MLPVDSWPAGERRLITGVFTDIDDTLTTEGAITQDALDALSTLKQAGLHVIPITGRPVGWSVPFAKTWPVDAIVAENGAVALVHHADGTMHKIYQQDAATRERNYARMQQVAHRVLREVPDAKLAEDSPGRETDIAIDHSEFAHLPQAGIDAALKIMRDEGMTATVSSIHINAWYGEHNKLEGARWIVRELLKRDLEAELPKWAYVGDSTNDQLMFEHFAASSVGVANIERFAAQLTHAPKYVTQGERGAGFAQFAQLLLAAR